MILQNWWFTSLLPQNFPPIQPLRHDIKVDVLIVGGGMTGMSAAAAFLEKGFKVAVIERNVFGGSSTGRSAGFLTPDSELELSQLERRFGNEGAKKIWQVPVSGINLIVERVKKYDLQCDLIKQDSLFVGIGKDGISAIKEEKEARSRVGFDSIVYDKSQLENVLGSKSYEAAVRYGNTYGISALQYVQNMKRILIDGGIQVYEATEAQRIKDHTVYTHAGSVTADKIIVAIDKIKPSLTRYSREVFHAQTFLSISEPLSDEDYKNLFPSGEQFQCWDSTLVYSYWRLTGTRRLLLGGGSAMTTFMAQWDNKEKVIDAVIKGFKARFPALKKLEFIQYWPGQIDTTRDLLPTVVRDAEAPHIHYAFGIVGLPWASFCGDFLARVILGTAEKDEMEYFSYFSDRRYFALPTSVQRLVGKPFLFSMNNFWAKYYQVDVKRQLKFNPNDF